MVGLRSAAGVGFFNPKQADAESGGGGGIERMIRSACPRSTSPPPRRRSGATCASRASRTSIKYGDDWRPEIQAALNKWKGLPSPRAQPPAPGDADHTHAEHVPSVKRRPTSRHAIDRAGGRLGPSPSPNDEHRLARTVETLNERTHVVHKLLTNVHVLRSCHVATPGYTCE